MKRQKPTIEELKEASHKTVPDVIGSHIKVLFCGINPGLYTAALGHHFGRPGNRFWPALYHSGFTPRLLDPTEDRELLRYGYGITNMVQRATNAASELSTEEYRKGGTMFTEKVRMHQPQWVAFVGIGAYRLAFNRPKAVLGFQEEKMGNTQLWVLPSTSGLNAHYTPKTLMALFSEFKKTVDRQQ